MRTPARPDDGHALAQVMLRLWDRYEQRCAKTNEPGTFAHLAQITGVEGETLRVLVRRAQAGPLKTGPSFSTVARVAVELGANLDELGRLVPRTSRKTR